MGYAATTAVSALGLFLGMLLCMELGRRIGLVGLEREPDAAQKGLGTLEGAVFALLGLLIAFTFSGAATRFEERRHLIGQEANAIGTAYLRISVLPDTTQPEMRELFRSYVDMRVATYRNMENRAETRAGLARQAAVQGEIWSKAITACYRPNAPASAAMLLLPALNEMIDITTTRVVATQNHPPAIIFILLGGLSLLSALLAGYGMSCRGRSWLHVLTFSAIISITVFVILDLEYPRLGLIRVDAADRVLIELRQSMK